MQEAVRTETGIKLEKGGKKVLGQSIKLGGSALSPKAARGFG